MADTDTSSSSSSADDSSSIDDEHQPISETCKKAKMADTSTTTTTTNVDFISGLPDAILCDILSHVRTKEAVATSVLSKRWNQVWTSVPNLDFRDWSDNSSRTPVYETIFSNFVDKVLSLNNVSSVRKIYLHCSDNCDSLRINPWISDISTRDTKEFDLCLPRSCLIENLDQISRIYSLPDTFFTCTTLVELCLENIALKVPTLVCFPSLETIRFDSVQLLDDDSMKNLLSGCPILRSLSIDRGVWDNAQTLYICSSTLHCLELQTAPCSKDSGFKVVIETPNLNYLYLTDEVDADYDILNLSSLVSASVGIEQDGRVLQDEDVFYDRLFELLRKISHLQELRLHAGVMRSFVYAPLGDFPMFSNLTRLEVEISYEESWPVLPYLFPCTPNLVTFLLAKGRNVHPHCHWCEPHQVPQCFLSSVEKIEINNFEECDDEMEMVYYFLQNAMMLKTMSICSFNLDLEKENKILKRLMLMSRSSSICQVKYTNTRM